MYFTPKDFLNVFLRLLSQVFIRDAPGISEKDENRSKSTKVTKVRSFIYVVHDLVMKLVLVCLKITVGYNVLI